MKKVITLAFAYLISSVAITPSIAQETDKYLFRYKAAPSAAVTTPEEEEENGPLRIIPYAEASSPLDYMGNVTANKGYIEIFGNGEYSGRGTFVFFAQGFDNNPTFTYDTSITDNGLNTTMSIEDASVFGINGLSGKAHYVMPTIVLPYNFNRSSLRVTATGDGKSVSANIPINVQRFDYGPLRMDSSGFASSYDAAPDVLDDEAEQHVYGNNSGSSLLLQGGVPPYNVTINTDDINDSNRNFFSNDFNSSVIENALAIEIDRVLHQYTFQNDPDTRVNRNIAPYINWGNCAQPGLPIDTANMRYSITVTDSTGATVTSPSQTIKYYPNRPGCYSFNWRLN